MIYSPGNAAKQWILHDIEGSLGYESVRILDLACGTAWIWETFIKTYPNAKITGLDTDERAIDEARKKYEGVSNIEVRVFDAQKSFENESQDIVVALSAIEHVVDREAFLKTVWDALKPGGRAYLNYDSGHFRSSNIKERIMVPVSQILALFGLEKWYMKQVSDVDFRGLAEKRGFRFIKVRKHNLHTLKGFMKSASVESINAWYAYEERLGELYAPDELDRIMGSTTVVLEKP
jgi:ubiquinone/menaquinone biosynthesis C-methylase UbiE